MPKNLEKYSKEFGDYLLSKGKSHNTVNRYCSYTAILLSQTGKTPETLSLRDVEKHVAWIRVNFNFSNKKTSFSAIKKYLRYLKLKYNNVIYDNYLKELDTTDEDMFHIKEKYQPESKEIIKPEEAERIFNVAESHPRDYAILKLFYYSWQRIGSIQNLNLEDIDYKGEINPENGKRYHRIHIKGAKNNQSYYIHIEDDVIEAIKRYLPFREKPILPEGITNYKGRKIEGYIVDNYGRKLYHKDALFLNGHGQRLLSRAMSNMMKQYSVVAGVNKRIYPHLWRASGITIAESNGISISQIMKRSGHTNIESLKSYLHPTKDETNMKISNALKGNKEKIEQQFKQEQNNSGDFSQQKTSQNVDQQVKLLELELANKKAEIELLKLRHENKTTDDNLSIYG